eukprot:scaffold82903_cov62-Attheya_sp.AAC.3
MERSSTSTTLSVQEEPERNLKENTGSKDVVTTRRRRFPCIPRSSDIDPDVIPSIRYVGKDSGKPLKPILSTTDAPKRLQRAVSFHTIEIREYKRALGDNPAVSYGPPIGIDWQYNHTESKTVDLYERERPPRGEWYEWYMTPDRRSQMLSEECGHSYQEIMQATNEADQRRRKRDTSLFLSDVCGGSLVIMESITRKLKRLVLRKRNSKRAVLTLWSEAHRQALLDQEQISKTDMDTHIKPDSFHSPQVKVTGRWIRRGHSNAAIQMEENENENIVLIPTQSEDSFASTISSHGGHAAARGSLRHILEDPNLHVYETEDGEFEGTA